jgi:hypothetical protein
VPQGNVLADGHGNPDFYPYIYADLYPYQDAFSHPHAFAFIYRNADYNAYFYHYDYILNNADIYRNPGSCLFGAFLGQFCKRQELGLWD